MLRKTLTIISLIGLLLSVGLWGVSFFGPIYFSPKKPDNPFPYNYSLGALDGALSVSFIGDWDGEQEAFFVVERLSDYKTSLGARSSAGQEPILEALPCPVESRLASENPLLDLDRTLRCCMLVSL